MSDQTPPPIPPNSGWPKDEEPRKTNTALIFAVVGLALGAIGLFFNPFLVPSILSVGLSVRGLLFYRRPEVASPGVVRGVSIGGLIVGAIALLGSIVAFILLSR